MMLKFTRIVVLLLLGPLYSVAHHTEKPARRDPDDCIKINASVFANGIEGSRDVDIKFKLPPECPAREDIVISIGLQNPQSNNGDFVLPDKITFKKGDTETDLIIKVTDDNYIETTEAFTINLTAGLTLNGYTVNPGASLSFTIIDNDNTPENRKYTITYSPQIAEGSSGNITISLPPGVLLSEALDFSFEPDKSGYQATTIQDYTPLSITMLAGTNTVSFNVNAFIDNNIEGDEFISGSLVTQLTFFGTFTSDNDQVHIKILDYENTNTNRIIEITPATDVLNEGTANTYQFALWQPSATSTIKLQYPLTINITQSQWAAYLKQSANALVLDNSLSDHTNLTLTYPDDQVIRANGTIKLSLSADDAHTGSYQFRWKSAATDALTISTVDNDEALLSLELSPTALTVAEGGQATITLNLANGIVLENDIAISYTWDGAGINTENRISTKTGTTVLSKGQNRVSIPINITDDQLINDNNLRTINFTALNYLLQPVPISPQNTVAVTIFDDDYTTLSIPNAFSPNGDSINDNWNIPNLAFDTNCRVNIFNRYGNNIFASTGYALPWDGTWNGKFIASGTYYYMISSHGKTHTGSVTVIR